MVEIKKVIADYINNHLSTAKKENCKKSFFSFLFDLKNNTKQLKMNIDTHCIVLSQYPSAETKGLGGLIAQNPKNFEILCFTNGSTFLKGADAIDSSAIAKQKFTEVMKKTRVKGYKIFDIADGTLINNYSTFKKIDISEANYIFIPNVYDVNPDTIALLKHFKELLKVKEYKENLKIFMFESDYSLALTDYYVDISSIIETKKRMLEGYFPKDKYIDYSSKITGLNAFRSLKYDCEYAETFLSLTVEEFLNIPVI